MREKKEEKRTFDWGENEEIRESSYLSLFIKSSLRNCIVRGVREKLEVLLSNLFSYVECKSYNCYNRY